VYCPSAAKTVASPVASQISLMTLPLVETGARIASRGREKKRVRGRLRAVFENQ
jgi:hypothetical protein